MTGAEKVLESYNKFYKINGAEPSPIEIKSQLEMVIASQKE